MKIELQVTYRNGDNGETTDDLPISIAIDNDELNTLIEACREDASEENLISMFKKFFDNPDPSDESRRGVAYMELWTILSRMAYDKLGWSDVMVDVVGISVDGETLYFNPDEVEAEKWSLQLERHEGYMYCYY